MKKTGRPCRFKRELKIIFGSFLLFPRRVLADGLVVQQIVHDVAHGILKAFLEFLEVLLVQENLVFVVSEGAVPFLTALAFRDGQVIIVIAFGGFDVKKIGSLAGAYRLGVHVLLISLLSGETLVIFTVHTFVCFFFFRLQK